MFFLLKCAFWLALVYAAMLYGFGPIRAVSVDGKPSTQAPRPVAEEALHASQAVVQAAVGGAATGAAALCAHRPTECLAEGARLTALFDASGVVEPSPIERGRKTHRSDRSPLADGDGRLASTSVPMPVPDPRRLGKVSRLTSGL